MGGTVIVQETSLEGVRRAREDAAFDMVMALDDAERQTVLNRLLDAYEEPSIEVLYPDYDLSALKILALEHPTPVPPKHDCRGVHPPHWTGEMWMCSICGIPLDTRKRH